MRKASEETKPGGKSQSQKVINVRGENGNDKSKLLFSAFRASSSCFECHYNFRFVTLKHATLIHPPAALLSLVAKSRFEPAENQ